MFVGPKTALVHQTNTNGKMFRDELPYLLELEVSVDTTKYPNMN